MRSLLPMLIVALVLAGCRTAPRPPVVDDAGPTDPSIQWPRDPYHVVFRMDIVGGEETLADRNTVPLCTIYGDNRIVWTDQTDQFQVHVFFDFLTDERIQQFVRFLTIEQRFYTYGTEDVPQPPREVEPVVETMSLHVNDALHTTDAFDDWPDGYFADILETCRTRSQAPATFEPQNMWIETEITEYSSEQPVFAWDEEVTGLNLRESTGSRLWVTNEENVALLWSTLMSTPGGPLFRQGGTVYRLAVEVPNVMRSAPPPPPEGERREPQNSVTEEPS